MYNCSFIENNSYNDDTNGTYNCNISSPNTIYSSFGYEICVVSNKTSLIKNLQTPEKENIYFIKINFWFLISFIIIVI